ncbi:polymorphic toxin type 24 domain-containing protein [Nocardia callitridis]|uniref:polymorphic toxin type 24 domain-containing protein n=1 Tax=Nocardia callitridis TaxID=648753 RepID=UPI0031EC1424
MDAYHLAGSLVQAVDNYAGVLQQAGYNYAVADHEKRSSRPAPVEPKPLAPAWGSCPRPPGSAGGPGGGLVDDGFELASMVGIPIPDGDPDKLLATADIWDALAKSGGIAGLPAKIEGVARSFETVTAPEASFIDEDLREMKTAAEDVITTFTDLAQSCREQKAAIDDLRTRLKDLLTQLAEDIAQEVAVTLLFSVVAGAFSAGFGAAAVAAFRAGKIAEKVRKYATRIKDIVEAVALIRKVAVKKATQTIRDKLQRIIDLGKNLGSKIKRVPKNSLKNELDNATTWTRRNLPTENGPRNGYLVKRDPQGNITRYSYYDADGIATKRVDLSGKSHYDKGAGRDIPTPHVVDITRHTDPATGRVFTQTDPSTTRPALPEEIP